jgi:electron transport complex protein RnfG
MSLARSSLLKSAAALGLVAVVGTTLLAGVHRLTADRIADQERRMVLEQLGQIVPPDRYDNAMHEDYVTFRDEQHFPQGQEVTAYRAREGGQPVAIILRFDAVDGYNGPIRLLAGIEESGRLAGVRVTSHRETPGLGDAIDAAKSDWVLGFTGRSLANPAPPGWAVERDGGEFDQFTGATITPRAVVEAIQRALEYYELSGRDLFDKPAVSTPEAAP